MSEASAPIQTVDDILNAQREIWEATKPYTRPRRPLTEMGLAETHVDLHADRIRYVPSWGSWLLWNGKRWERDERKGAEALARITVRFLQAEAALGNLSRTEREAQLKFAASMETAYRVQSFLTLASSDQRIVATPAELDTDPIVLNTPHGVVDLIGGKIRPATPEDLVTKMTAVGPDFTKEPVKFLSFLDDIFQGSEEIIGFVRRWLGYCLIGHAREQKALIAWGEGQNGKNTLFNLIVKIIGDYAREIGVSTFFENRSGGGIPNDVAALQGLRLAVTSENSEGRFLEEERFKTVVGGDPIQARFLHGEFFTFRPVLKLVIHSNNRPRIKASDFGMWRRIILLPFYWRCPEEKKNKGLEDELFHEEGGAILAWMLKGCREYQNRGLDIPPELQSATEEYRDSEDQVARFIAECCTATPGASEMLKTVFEKYQEWAKTNGEGAMSAKRFSQGLARRNIGSEHTRAGNRLSGLRLNWEENDNA